MIILCQTLVSDANVEEDGETGADARTIDDLFNTFEFFDVSVDKYEKRRAPCLARV